MRLLESFHLPINEKTTKFIKEFVNDQGGLESFAAKTLKKIKKQAPIAPNFKNHQNRPESSLETNSESKEEIKIKTNDTNLVESEMNNNQVYENENLEIRIPPKPLPRKSLQCQDKKESETQIEEIQKAPTPLPRKYTVTPSAPPIEVDEDICKICFINELECVFYDCGHMMCCIKCSSDLTHCPICRNEIIQSIKVFK